MTAVEDILRAAREIRDQRYPDAAVVFAAGSLLRGEGTAHSDLLDDLRDPRSRGELVGTAARLFEALADYHLRAQGSWSASGKAIPRALTRADPALAVRYARSFDDLFTGADVRGVMARAEALLAPQGGLLFDGYRSEAPATWRRG